MTALTIRLPNSVPQKIKELAERDDISVKPPPARIKINKLLEAEGYVSLNQFAP